MEGRNANELSERERARIIDAVNALVRAQRETGLASDEVDRILERHRQSTAPPLATDDRDATIKSLQSSLDQAWRQRDVAYARRDKLRADHELATRGWSNALDELEALKRTRT